MIPPAYDEVTSVNPVGGGVLFIGMFLLVCLPKRSAWIPLLITACYIPLGQRVMVFGVAFTILRILLMAGIMRVIVRGEAGGIVITRIDRVFCWWVVASVILGTLGNPPLFVNRMGLAYDALCTFWLLRALIRNSDELVTVVETLAIICIPLACVMLWEHASGRNVFSVLGGVPAETVIREGQLRCQGAFRHPILAGTFGATLMPVFIGLWFQGRTKRWTAVAGFLAAAAITVTSGSSGPVLAALCAVLGWLVWPFRYRMHLFRRGSVIILCLLAMIMKAPVWYLMARLSFVAGGTGWHRAWLMDQAVNHIGEWWLLGTPYTAHWGPSGQVLEVDPNNMDITNQYILEGVQGGFLKLILFVTVIVLGFRAAGNKVRQLVAEGIQGQALPWSLGIALFCHCVSFMSISYFDQLRFFYYAVLAMLAVVASEVVVTRDVEDGTLAVPA